MNTLLPKISGTADAIGQRLNAKIVNFKAQGKMLRARLPALAVATGMLMLSNAASAITAPAAGSFGYDMYDIGVNSILKGAPGFVGGTAGIVYAATQLSKNWIAAALGILACSAVLKADSITTSLGLVV